MGLQLGLETHIADARHRRTARQGLALCSLPIVPSDATNHHSFKGSTELESSSGKNEPS